MPDDTIYCPVLWVRVRVGLGLTLTLSDRIRVRVEGSDGWKGYSALSSLGFAHETVLHNKQFVRRTPRGKVQINSLEGAHGLLKQKGREMHLFRGQPAIRSSMKNKLKELVFRFNTREEKDKFFLFLKVVLMNYPACSCTTPPALVTASGLRSLLDFLGFSQHFLWTAHG